jgi:hypothetical protein
MVTPKDHERQEHILTDGLEAMRQVKGDHHFGDWMRIKDAMEVITERACAKADVPEWDNHNRELIKVFGELWDEYEGRLSTNHKPLSKQERSALRFLLEHPEVASWRETQPGDQKRRLNHPNAVINKWRAKTQPKKPSTKPSMRESVVALEEELHRVKAHNAELEAANGNASGEEGREIARLKIAHESEIQDLKEATKLTIDQHIDGLANLLKAAGSEAAKKAIAALWSRLETPQEEAPPKPAPKKAKAKKPKAKAAAGDDTSGDDIWGHLPPAGTAKKATAKSKAKPKAKAAA